MSEAGKFLEGETLERNEMGLFFYTYKHHSVNVERLLKDYAEERMEPLVKMLEEAKIQIEYLHNKFGKTGSGNNVLTKIENVLDQAKIK